MDVKVDERISCRYSMANIWTFRGVENNHMMCTDVKTAWKSVLNP